MATPQQFRRRGRLALFTAILVGALVVSGIAFGYVSTDLSAYAPGSTVTISGGNDTSGAPGYVAGNTVDVAASGGSGWSDSCSATIASDGTWSCQVILSSDPSISGGNYTYTATSTGANGDPISESGTFTDGSVRDVTFSGPYQSNCTTTASSFVQGDTVCVGWTASTIGGLAPEGFHLVWLEPDGTTVAADDNFPEISDGDKGTDSYTLANDAPTGTWTVIACRPAPAPCNHGTFISSTTFTVTVPPAVTPTLATEVRNAADDTANTSFALGTAVYDHASLTATNGTPTGSVTFKLYKGATCSNRTGATLVGTSETVDLASGAANSSHTAALHANTYFYLVTYTSSNTAKWNSIGDANAECEDFTITKADTTTTTKVYAGTTDITNGSVPQGVTIHDTATVSSTNTSGFTFAGTNNIVYKLYSGACGTGALLTGGTTTTDYPGNSADYNTSGSPLPVGSYCFQAQYLGNGDYNGSTSDPEPFTVVPAAVVTDSSLCTFAEDGTQNQFRLIYTPDMGTSVYKLNASNPGQFYYNVFHFGAATTLTISIPGPFVTQGAVPTHVYSGVSLSASTPPYCLTPGTLVGQNSSQVSGTNGGNIQVSVPAGFSYIAIHLDYGYKGYDNCQKDKPSTGAATCSSPGSAIITSPETYNFAGVTPTVQSENVFKRDPGIGGLVTQSEIPVVGATVNIYDGNNHLLGTVTTDSDGWYMWNYKYSGKAATFVVQLPAYGKSQTVTLKSNGFLVVNFSV
jgi:hypothetical protein